MTLSIIIFIIWLVITSPVHGSKGLISTFLFLALLPWIRSIRFITIRSFILIAAILLIFFFGLYLRNLSWIDLNTIIPYSLNYFTTTRNMILMISDFNPNFLQTFFLPFNKFLTPIGLSDMSLYYDMNHMLTDKYFPTAWEIRATEQWPVEADLYLNFYFFFGLPLIAIYTYLNGYIYGRARISSNLGIWAVAILLMVSIVSHFRGSLYNHIDFYFYPMIFVIYLLLRNKSFSDKPALK